MDLRGHAWLCVFAPAWMNAYECVCVVPCGKNAPAMVNGSIDRGLCATHVKFMFCAAFTKEPWNGFRGNIMPEQWEDGAEDSETCEKQSRERGPERERERYKRGKVNVPSRSQEEKVKTIPLHSQRVE